MTCSDITRILDKKNAKYFIDEGGTLYVANEFMDEVYYIRVRFKDSKYVSHRANYDETYSDVRKKENKAQWDCSHHEQVLHSGLPARVSRNVNSLLEAIDR